jgi:hypothetical protein
MPTEHHYRGAADRCRTLARQLADQAAWAPPAPAARFTTAPAVCEIIDGRFAAMMHEIDAAVDGLRRLASICDARADICRNYRWALSRYHQASAPDRECLRYPLPPYGWVEA